jgi:glycine/D-amino acid oxidase-like deaminating enzyme
MANDPNAPPTDSTVNRRSFIKAAGLGAGILLLDGCTTDVAAVPGLRPKRRIPFIGGSSDVVVIGAGVWGGFTAYNLLKMGARVTLVDAYGPGNARSTSGDESRGVRSSYGDRDTGVLWMQWAREAMLRWRTFDEEWGRAFGTSLYFTTGDLIMRDEWEPFTNTTRDNWKKHGVPFEILKPDDVKHRWPAIELGDTTAILYEPDAGVIRARRSAQAVAAAFERSGGTIHIGRARPGKVVNGVLQDIVLDTGQTLTADRFVWACGPWLPKTFPEILEKKMRAPIGQVCYFGTPVNDERFRHPNMPSWNFPGVTGWAALPVDNRGFRVRGSIRPKPVPGAPPPPPRPPTPSSQLDPDTSDRWVEGSRLEGPRRVLETHFPALKDAPILATHACHYELSSSQNFIVDRHPQMHNAWIAGAGNAEGFKFAPVIGEYIAQRVLEHEGDPEIDKGFRIPAKEYEPTPLPAPAQVLMAGTPATTTQKK